MDAIVSLSALLDQAPIHVNVAGAALLHYSEAIVPPTEGEPLAHYFAFAQSLHELALACLMAPRVADRFKAQGQRVIITEGSSRASSSSRAKVLRRASAKACSSEATSPSSASAPWGSSRSR